MNKWKNGKWIDAFKNSIKGFKIVFKNERNIKIQSVFAILAIIAGFLLQISLIEFALILVAIFVVFISEFLNTAVENTVDMVTEEYNEKAKNAKDVAAAAVTLSAILSIIIGLIIFLPKIMNMIIIN